MSTKEHDRDGDIPPKSYQTRQRSYHTRQRMFLNPFSDEGRITRSEYWISCGMFSAYMFILRFLQLSAAEVSEKFVATVLSIIFFILEIPAYWFLLAQGAKRCHDRRDPGLDQIIPFYFLWMLFADGDKGANEYGPDPKGRMSKAK